MTLLTLLLSSVKSVMKRHGHTTGGTRCAHLWRWRCGMARMGLWRRFAGALESRRARRQAKIYKFYLQPGLEELKQSKRDAGVNLVWFTTYLLMLLFGFRGDTIGGVDDTGTNCKVFTDLHIYFEVNRVKCRNETETAFSLARWRPRANRARRHPPGLLLLPSCQS